MSKKQYCIGIFSTTTVFILSFWAVFFYLTERADSQTFGFNKGQGDWQSWGNGDIGSSSSIAHSGSGSVYLDCDSDENRVLYKEITLNNGTYKISAWLRGLSIQQSRYKEGILLYYKAENENKGVVNFVDKNIHGSFDWSKVEYTVDVKNKRLQIWFSLRTPGRLWIDDISIEPYSGKAIPFKFTYNKFSSPPNNHGEGIRCSFCNRWWDTSLTSCPLCGEDIKTPSRIKRKVSKQKNILNFENTNKEEEGSAFTPEGYDTVHVSSGEQSGVISSGKYNNIKLKTAAQINWKNYDYIALDIYNPTDKNFKFSLAVSDKKTKGYWDQLNHYSTLASGWNTMKFPLHQYVGERGSVRTKRYLNLSRINKFWFRVDSTDKSSKEELFYVDNIRLGQSPDMPAPFPGLLLFDFVKEKFRTYHGFIPVGTRDMYNKETGFGFIDTLFWRAHDSLYADKLYRDGIFVKKGRFQIDLPNGKYIVRLVPNALGEWFEHFWSQRKIRINGKTILSEQRRSAQDYLDELLRFQDIEPRLTDNAYDLYLREIFSEIITEVNVTKGKIELSFQGDDSAIMLNSLIIYPLARKAEGDKFITKLLNVQRDEFANICRFAKPDKKVSRAEIAHRKEELQVLFLDKLAQRHTTQKGTEKTDILLTAVRRQYPAQTLQLNTTKKGGLLTITASDLKMKTGETIALPNDALRYGVRQYCSHTLNHETYDLLPQFLKPINSGIYLDKNDSVLLYYQLFIPEQTAAGTYYGDIEITFNGKKKRYPVELDVLDITLPETDIPVGFFGLDPVPFAYFKGRNVKKVQEKFRTEGLKLLRKKGFTTWTSLPPMQYKKGPGANWVLKTENVDKLMKTAADLGFRHKVFTYGSPDNWILQKVPGNIDKDKYWKNKSRLLKTQMAKKNWLPIVVDISDEAAGYSQKVERDLKRAETMETYFPYLQRGGYTQPIKKGEYGDDLNMKLNVMSLSSITDNYRKRLKKSDINWGRYTQAAGIDDANRKKFGLDLFLEWKKGSQHLLGWSLSLSQNYPYYDLDGRERDAMMFYPRKNGTLLTSINFEQAAKGLEDYRLLCLLEKRFSQHDNKDIVKWLKDNYIEFSAHPEKMREKIYNKLLLINRHK